MAGPPPGRSARVSCWSCWEGCWTCPEPPHRIGGAYDISNTGSDDIVASMVVFVDGRPQAGLPPLQAEGPWTEPDDYASMKQVLTRRFPPVSGRG